MRDVRVFIADDNAAVRETLEEMLERAPAVTVVGTAEAAETAIEACSRLRPDVALVDVHMPGGGGRRVILELRVEKIPVVIITADPDPSLHDAMLALGAHNCVVKMDNLDRIAEAVLDAARPQ
jgi:DNA-binding NarL/FixJ family response regulator